MSLNGATLYLPPITHASSMSYAFPHSSHRITSHQRQHIGNRPFQRHRTKKTFTNYKQAEGERQREGAGAECGRDTSRKLYLHHLHMKLVCTTATAAGQVESQAGAAWGWGSLELQLAFGLPIGAACHVDLYKYIKSQITIFRRLK